MMSDLTQVNKMAVRDFVDAADVKGNFLYRKDGVILAYLRIYFFNIELMNQAERRALSNNLAAQFKADRKDFVYTTLPREVDMDKYRQSLKERHGSEIDLGRRQLLTIMMNQSQRLISAGENYEHQHYIKIWAHSTAAGRKKVEERLAERISQFEAIYKSVGIKCEIMGEQDIVKLCNLYGNSLNASMEPMDETERFSSILQL